jgi:hypothetical protein
MILGKRVIERRSINVRRKLSGVVVRIKNALGNVGKVYYYQLML